VPRGAAYRPTVKRVYKEALGSLITRELMRKRLSGVLYPGITE